MDISKLKIVISGSHRTGKTTLLKGIKEKYPNANYIERTIKNYWEKSGVEDFEKLPTESRAVHEKYLLMNQINLESEFVNTGFISDRSVTCYWGYTEVSSCMSPIDKKIFKHIIVEHVKKYYDKIIYLPPVDTQFVNERLSANEDTQAAVANSIESIVKEFSPDKYFIPQSTTIEQRYEEVMEHIRDMINN